jgi:hypothetical protein
MLVDRVVEVLGEEPDAAVAERQHGASGMVARGPGVLDVPQAPRGVAAAIDRSARTRPAMPDHAHVGLARVRPKARLEVL